MNEVIVRKIKGQDVVCTFDIFKGLGYAGHRELKQVIEKNKMAFLSLGKLERSKIIPAFTRGETLQATDGVPRRKQGRPQNGYLLNFRQYMLLVMVAKNSPESLNFKMKIEADFNRMREELSKYNESNPYLDRIRKILLLDAPSEWERIYPDEYYIALMKLYGDKFIDFKNGLPAYCGAITKRWVYDVILPNELRNETLATPGTKRHQWFTEQNGRATLKNHIGTLTMIARTSQSRKEFEARCATQFEGAPLQLSVFL
jgi:hypothetical protein